MTTFLELQTAIKSRLKESATDVTTTARVKECINVAYKEIANLKKWSFLTVIDASIAGTGVKSYAVAADCNKPLNCRYGTAVSSATKLDKCDRIDILREAASGTAPGRYCIPKDGYIEVDYAVTAPANLYYDYIKVVTDMSADGDVCLIPDKWVHVLKQLSLYYALDADDDSRAQGALTKYMIMQQAMLDEDYSQTKIVEGAKEDTQ